MAKLYFRHGTMGGAKTLNLLAVAHNYRQQGKKILLMKPGFDTRFGKEKIRSRAGLEMLADVLIEDEKSLKDIPHEGVACILVDEAHFLSAKVIDRLREIALCHDIPVLCYGLRTDFKSLLFEGSKRLMELSDSIEEVKSTCHFCNRKSIMNLKHVDGVAVSEGPSIELGADEKYFPACFSCYQNQIEKAATTRRVRSVLAAAKETSLTS
jgi:thymidine kinase